MGIYSGAEQAQLEGNSNIADTVYMYSRTAAGWRAIPMGPPASSYVSYGLYDASTNLNTLLWELSPVGGLSGGNLESAQASLKLATSAFYIERSSGVFESVGPETPKASGPNILEYEYIGASADLSHILFSDASGYRWPYDETISQGSTLYEYIGTERPDEEGTEQSGEPTRKPTLVGVRSGAGNSTLISQCGTRLGSSSLEERHEGSMYNAISESGARIFFTAVGSEEAQEACKGPRVGELFAREEVPSREGELPAANMRTVAISEPSREDCETCLTEEGSRAASVFQGASQNGSKVFFTTEQELLPGAKGENLYEYNFEGPAGRRVTLLSAGAADPEVQGVARISEDGSHVYFVASGRLTNESRGGGCLATLSKVELEEEETTKEGRCRPKEGANNLYVYTDGHVAFIATLVPSTSETSRGDSRDWASADNRPVLASEEGRFLVLTSVGDLTGEGLVVADEKPQVFQYDAEDEELVRVSVGENGYNDDDRDPHAGSRIINGFLSAYGFDHNDSPTSASSAVIPANGAVFFSSPDALTSNPQALNDQVDSEGGELVPNIYEYLSGQVYLLSDGRDISTVAASPASHLVGWDSSGNDVFFFTSDPLIPEDEDTQEDLYDARVDGGFPTSPAQSQGCVGEASCQGALAGVPALVPLGGSATRAAEAEAVPTPTTSATTKPKVAKPKRTARTKRTARRKRRIKTKGKRAAKKADATRRHVQGSGKR
jgi:hypothetical protein